MMDFAKKNQGISIFRAFLYSICAILSLFMFLLTALTTLIIFSRLDGHISSLLDRSLVVAWQEYDGFFQKTETALSLLAPSLDEINEDEIAAFMNSEPEIDFWLAFDSSGNALAGNLNTGKLPLPLKQLAASCLTKKITIRSSETMPTKFFVDSAVKPNHNFLIDLQDEPEMYKDDYYVENNQKLFAWVLTRSVAIPFFSDDGSLQGCLLAGDIVNNNKVLPANYSSKIEGSYLSISIKKGVRIVSNIKSSSRLFFLGTHQHKDLVEAISKGQRYSGRTTMEPGNIHLIASDPITNSEGDIIGALSVGIPSEGIATVKRDTLFTILLTLGICLIIALLTARYIAQTLSRPLASLTSLTRNISGAEEPLVPEQFDSLDYKSRFRIREINHLQHYLQKMAETIHRKSQEKKNYLSALEAERSKLRKMTSELQAANISLEKKVNERTSELRKAVVNLKTMDAMKTKFLANMSHELRTPLNSIIGFSEMLSDEIFGELNPRQKDYIDIILNSARDLLQIISDILDLSRVKQGELSLDKEHISIEKLISSILTIVNPQINSKNQTLTVKIDPELPLLYADPVRVKQVLYNLLSNANKFTPFGGEISITAGLVKGEMKISVIDNGIGIKEEQLDHIFDEFYQSGTLYESKYEGVGLGLPLSKRLVELHNGKIELVSKPGEGTTVSFTLPIVKETDL